MATDSAQGKHSSNFRTDLRNLAATGFRRLPGFRKKGVKTTVSVDPGTIDAGLTGTAAVTVTGAVLTGRQQKVVAVPPATLAAGLRYAGVAITADDEVTITVENTTGSSIPAAAVNWDVYLFDGV